MAHLPGDLFWPAPPTCSTARLVFVVSASWRWSLCWSITPLWTRPPLPTPPHPWGTPASSSSVYLAIVCTARQPQPSGASKVARRKRVTTPLSRRYHHRNGGTINQTTPSGLCRRFTSCGYHQVPPVGLCHPKKTADVGRCRFKEKNKWVAVSFFKKFDVKSPRWDF